MSTTAAMRVSRQGFILATAAAIHGAAFLLITSGLVPRIRFTEPPAIVARILPRPLKPVVPVAPDATGVVDYEPLPQPQPLIDWPAPDETQAPTTGPTESTGAGEGPDTRAVEFVGPMLRTRDSRLAGLVDRCYPAGARRRNEEGRVEVRVIIDASGRAGAFGVEQGSGFPQLDAAVDCVIRRLEFEPARRAGSAVEATVLLPILFRLD